MSATSYTAHLTSEDPNIRRKAALILGSRSASDAVPALLDRLAIEEDSCVREDLTWAVVQHANDAEDALRGMLESTEAASRATGAHVVSKIGDAKYFESVSKLLHDPHPDVAIKAYRAVANTGDPRSAETLLTCLGDGDQLQRDALTHALASLGQEAVNGLINVLAVEDQRVRQHSVEVLGQIGTPEADVAGEALHQLAAQADDDLAISAVSALAQLAGSNEALRSLADSQGAVSAVAEAFLARRESLPGDETKHV